jgi:predicted ATP-grasp superfamily ATP-dependent carboligase
LTYQHAASVGIDCPGSYHPRGVHELGKLDCCFPVILKPTVREETNAFTRAKAWRCDDLPSLVSRYEQATALVGENNIVLQELIPGNGTTQFSCAGVWNRGAPVVSLVARRTRQYPIDFGYTSTFVETVERPEVEEAACRFLRSLEYTGLAELEFKYDERDGRYKLLDFNARAWTWNALGSIAGVDFGYALWRLAQGEVVAPIRGNTEVAWMHASRDMVAAFHEMRAGGLSMRRYLRGWRRPLVFAAFAKDDPLPGLLDLPLTLYRMLPRRRASLAPKIKPAYRSGLRPSD